MRRSLLTALAAVVVGLGFVRTANAGISLNPVGTYASGVFFDGDFGAAEIPAYDATSRRVFVVNAQLEQIDVLDVSDPSMPTKLGSIELSGRPNSATVFAGLLAVAVEASPKTDPGTVVLYRASCDPTVPANCEPLNEITVGALPDMLTFSPNGRYLLVANEGEPEGDVDPKGTVSVIDLRKGIDRPIVNTVDFTPLDGGPVPVGVIVQTGKLPSVDFEPEYITVSENSKTAWVALQEANAIAEIDVKNATLVAVRGLGFKNHGLPQNSLDVSDRDNAINLCTWPNVFGMYQPDGIAAYKVKNRYYIVTANEGDSRDADAARVGDLPSTSFDSTFPSSVRNSRNLGRLTVNRNLGLESGIYKQLYVYGARSFAIWSDTGELVYDSANEFERIIASFPSAPPSPLVLNGPAVPAAPAATCPVPSGTLPSAPPASTPFNSNHEAGPSFDNRSDNKGPEPEGITLGRIGERTYAFVGLERTSGIMVYDITDPAAPAFVQYVNPRNFAAVYALPDDPGDWQEAGDLGPEGLAFIRAEDSPIATPLLVVANEVSGTTTVYTITSP